MALDTKIQSTSRSGGTGITAGDAVYLNADSRRNLLVTQGGSKYGEMARAGGIWNVKSAAAAPLVAVPTTTALLEVYNNTNSGMAMEILEVFYFHLLGTAALHNISIWGQVTAQKVAPSTGSLVVASQSGRGIYTDTAITRVTTGTSTTVIANGWRPIGATGPGVVSTALPGEGQSFPVDGQFWVPAGCSFCLQTVDALATASSVQMGLVWNEVVGAVSQGA